MIAASAAAMITAWPRFSMFNDTELFTAARSNRARASSNRRASCASLPKYFTVS